MRHFLFATSFLFLVSRPVFAAPPSCPGANDPPPPVLKADLPKVIATLEGLRDTQGRPVWKKTTEAVAALIEVFESTSAKTRLEQFFQLLHLLQRGIPKEALPAEVRPPGITDLLISARVFTERTFPERIVSVALKRDNPHAPPSYAVKFAAKEVRFPINQGKGFSTWDQGMCQIAKELIFYPGFSFRLRKARNSQNLVVDDFERVQLYGQFGSRKIVSIDLNYVDLEKVEFIRGTDEGRVKARVARREFEENPHSFLFRLIGTLIPNSSRQRIDW